MKFLNTTKPSLVAMIAAKTSEDAICQITNSLYDGADAFGIQLCHLRHEFQTPDELRNIFSHCQGKPIYVTAYRTGENTGYTYEMCLGLLKMAYECGATLLDIPGDFFGGCPNGMSFDNEVVEKQKALISELKATGAEVLMSCHHSEFLGEEEIIRHAKAQQERGADIIKVVSKCNSEEDILVHLHIIQRLKKELTKPFLYLASGTHGRLVRQLGPSFGVSMYLCVDHYTPGSTKFQPKLSSTKLIRDNLIF